jgi:hypothetical protein
MILTGENSSSGRKTCHSATLFITINPTCTGLGWNPSLRSDRPGRSVLILILNIAPLKMTLKLGETCGGHN